MRRGEPSAGHDRAGRAQATRAWVGERESGARHLALPRGNLTFRLGLREPTDPVGGEAEGSS